ncbi:inositol monophosphatase family protein [Massilia pseudoviolaceinigra]|uniref:inositol monophosphatase family protein n=1 Tax=Massilia pseudoviolaceinigra TaxID=3057165 RepID=UPI0027968279|nr:inositol monophosphatase family protein [Massilia sp. CCM 9206]MDQ1922036.1 inositol monophosphatase family protein [Massilia sp. CCM 9206]
MNHPESSSIPTAGDQALLLQTVAAVQAAGQAVKSRFDPAARPRSMPEIAAAITANDVISMTILREALSRARPHARWDDDEEGRGALPPGEWWVCDPVEGAINHIHGLPDWGVTATLVRDNVPVLCAIHLPLSGATYTALSGGGAWLNGTRLNASSKSDLRTAMVGTGQAAPNEGTAAYLHIGRSVAAMLEAALVVQVSVPSTLQLIRVAAGHQDLFWQASQVRSGLLAGALLVAEAGGRVSDLVGAPWNTDSGGFLAGAPALTAQALAVLASLEAAA